MSNPPETCDISNALTFQELMDIVDSTPQAGPFQSDLPLDWDYIPQPLVAFATSAPSTSELSTPQTIVEASLFPRHEAFDVQHYHDGAQDSGWPLLVSSSPEVPGTPRVSVSAQVQDTFNAVPGPASLKEPSQLPEPSMGPARHGYDDFAWGQPVPPSLAGISSPPNQRAARAMGNGSGVLHVPSLVQNLTLPRIDERASDCDGEGSEYDFNVAAGSQGVVTDWTPILSPRPSSIVEPALQPIAGTGGRQGKPSRKSRLAQQSKPSDLTKRKRAQETSATPKGASDPRMQLFRDELQVLLAAKDLKAPAPYFKAQRMLAYDDPLCINNDAARDAQLRAKKNPQRTQCLFLSPTDVTFGRCQSQAKNMQQHRLNCHPVYKCNADTGERRWVYNLGSFWDTSVDGASEEYTGRAFTREKEKRVANEKNGSGLEGWILTPLPLGRGRRGARPKVELDDESEKAGLSW